MAVFPEIPGFKIIELLGEGAMAKVYLAEQLFHERKVRNVALKVMNRALSLDPSFRDRFVKEAEDTARFNHEGIVTIYTMNVHDDRYYLALEYLESGTLKERLRARVEFLRESGKDSGVVFGDAEALTLLRQLAEALRYAHEQGVIHRDLKPANILFRANGRAVLSDFGIAKSLREVSDLTQTGHAIGTPAYMSPEQRLGADVDERSDLFSLGVVFYEVLTGRKPYDTRTGSYAQLRQQLDSVPEFPTQVSHLQGLLDGLLARDPDERFQSAGELIQAINALAPGSGVTADDATVIQRAPGKTPGRLPRGAGTGKPTWTRKRILIAAGVAGAVALAAAATVWLMPEPAPDVVPVDEKTAREIDGLLETAELFVAMNDLIDSTPSNAIDVYTRVLELQPGNPSATAGLEAAFEQVLAQIESAIEAGDMEQARMLIRLSEHYFPDHKRLSSLKNEADDQDA